MSRADRPTDCTAGILCGGQGARFGGCDKAWIELRGRPLIEWTLDAVRPQAQAVLISANRNLERYRALGLSVVPDEEAGYQGPFAGMVQLLTHAGTPRLLCVPCDAVLLPADLAVRLVSAVEAEGADIAVLADERGIHPTFCLVPTRLAADATASYAAGMRAPREWFARHRVAKLQGQTPVNVNTPEALAALELRL